MAKRIRDLFVLIRFHRRDFRHVELSTLAMFAEAFEVSKEAVLCVKLHMARQALRGIDTQPDRVVIFMFDNIVKHKLHLRRE